MTKHHADSVESYLAALADDRRAALERLRRLILARLPAGYIEAFSWGMISYEVPLETSGKTYNGKPLMYAALASQKTSQPEDHMGLYLCGLYCLPAGKGGFAAAFKAKGKKRDMGQACIRFKKLDDLDLDAIGNAIASVTLADFIAASQRAPHKRKISAG